MIPRALGLPKTRRWGLYDRAGTHGPPGPLPYKGLQTRCPTQRLLDALLPQQRRPGCLCPKDYVKVHLG